MAQDCLIAGGIKHGDRKGRHYHTPKRAEDVVATLAVAMSESLTHSSRVCYHWSMKMLNPQFIQMSDFAA
jgi:hypothetical protein